MAIPATFRLPIQNVDAFDDCQLNFENLQTLLSAPTGLLQPVKAFWAAGNGVAFTSGAALPFDTIAWDTTGGAMKTGASAGYVCPVTGYYFVAGQTSVSSTAAAQFNLSVVEVAGTAVTNGSAVIATAAAQSLQSEVTGIVKGAAGQKITLNYFGTTGLLGAGTTENTNRMMVMRVA